jgi:hypothetical protein
MSNEEKKAFWTFSVRDVLYLIGMIGAGLAVWFGTQGRVEALEQWGVPPAGRLYVLEQSVQRHHEVVETVQDNAIKADHERLLSLEGEIARLRDAIDRQNKLQDQLLMMLKNK